MNHLGDITKIHGGTAPVVDAVIGGSPCQELSIAGKRAGLAGERSGLYMAQIRVIREMREHDRANGRSGEFIRPRYMVWENVPGAFSSNHGKDFAAVLEEAVKIVEPEAPLFLCLKRDGPQADASWETDGALLGQARMGTGGNQGPLVAYGIGKGQVNEAATMAFEKAQTLNTMHDAQAVFCQDVAHTLEAKANLDFREDSETYPVHSGKVRRLTPLECERLQGFPDGWTDIGDWVDSKGKKRQTTDSARYKALGNSIALPPWKWVLKRICAQYERDATMASLFDGIGGFPLIWEQLNGKGSCLWASEIEEFPMAVTRKHFG